MKYAIDVLSREINELQKEYNTLQSNETKDLFKKIICELLDAIYILKNNK